MYNNDLDFTMKLVDAIWKAVKEVADKPNVTDIIEVSDEDVTRRIDKIAEEQAIEYIQSVGEPTLFISEESPPQKIGSNPTKVVILDPIDGSTNYVRGIPHSSISAALATLNQDTKTFHVHVGVVKDIDRGDTFYASEGSGAYYNGTKLQIPSGETDSTSKPLINVYTYDGETIINTYKLQRYCNIRTLGSIALELCYLAASKLDGVIDIRGRLRTPDIAASILILEEAGGFIYNAYHKPVSLKIENKYKIVASYSKQMIEWLFTHL
jgi:myo-inositol-1(or 4)-monophosphatase